MKRLREMRESDPLIQQAQQLLSVVEPISQSPARMRRIRQAVEAQAVSRGTGRRHFTFALAASLVFVGTALAAAQGGSMIRGILASVTQLYEPSVAQLPSPARARRAVSRRIELPSVEIEAESMQPEAAPPSAASSSTPQPRRHVRERTAETELVRLAVKALRRDDDAGRAARMLEEAYARNPHSALAEEVMSLRVEAALARRDPRAQSYAKQYLARYPNGRYQALAHSATERAE